MARCDYQCQKCHFDYFKYFQKVRDQFSEQIRQGLMNFPAYQSMIDFPKDYPTHWFWGWMVESVRREFPNKLPEVDHIQALGLGGNGLFFDNLQILCKECHAAKTREDMDLILRKQYEDLREEDSSPKD